MLLMLPLLHWFAKQQKRLFHKKLQFSGMNGKTYCGIVCLDQCSTREVHPP